MRRVNISIPSRTERERRERVGDFIARPGWVNDSQLHQAIDDLMTMRLDPEVTEALRARVAGEIDRRGGRTVIDGIEYTLNADGFPRLRLPT